MRSPLLLSCFVVAWVLFGSGAVSAATPRVFNGTPVTNPAETPWAVGIAVSEQPLCSGSLIDQSRVLTAAHCIFQPRSATPIEASDFSVVAGRTMVGDPATGQSRRVVAAEAHPYFDPLDGISSDDVAVLTVDPPFDTSSPAVRPVALAPARSGEHAGANVFFAGFGRPAPDTFGGALRSYAPTVVDPGACGRHAAIVCVVSSTSSACSGDSGGGLLSGDRARLLGVLSFGQNKTSSCAAAIFSGFTDLTQPEIREFIEGSKQPLRAPRPRGLPEVAFTPSGAPVVGGILRCAAPPFEPAAEHLSYTFVDLPSERVVQSGASPTFSPTPPDEGEVIGCRVIASNAAGTSVISDERGYTVLPAPATSVADSGAAGTPSPLTAPLLADPVLTVAVGSNGAVKAMQAGSGLLTLTATSQRGRGDTALRVALAPNETSVRLPRFAPGVYEVCVASPPTGNWSAARSCATYTRTGSSSTLLRTHPLRATPRRRAGVRLTVPAGLTGRVATLNWLAASCRTCRRTTIDSERATLRRTMTLTAPRSSHRHDHLFLNIGVPKTTVAGTPYRASTLRVPLGQTR